MFKPDRKEKENEQLAEELPSDIIEESLTDNDILLNGLLKLMKLMKVPVRDSHAAEIEAQIWLEIVYPTPEDKANCQFLNLVTKDKIIKFTGPLDLTGFSSLRELICDEQKITEL